jgi:hypothetical protein
LLGYLVLAAAVMFHVLRHPASQFPGTMPDPNLFSWWLAWAQAWWGHGGGLLHTNLINAPVGVSALWNTSVLGLGLPVAPVTAIAGPVVAYNLLMVAGMATSAWATALAAARWASPLGATISGLLGGFGAYTLAHAHGHLNLVWTVYPALLLLLGADLVRGARPVRIGLLIGIATFWQFFVSSEMLTTSWLFAGVIAVMVMIVRRPDRQTWRAILVAGSTAFAVGVVLLGYPLVLAVTSPDRLPDTLRRPVSYSADLANLVVPTSIEQWAP